MNSTTSAPSLPANAGSAPATVPFHSNAPWPGLREAAEQIGVPLAPDALRNFDLYRDLLLQENVRFNLTAIRQPTEVERRLFLNALAMIPAIDHFLAQPDQKRGSARLVDVGSGAGFPGLALKIARPRLDVTLVDATGKKVAYLERTIAALGLKGVRAIQDRAETLGQDARFREQFTLATARGVASLPVLVELVMPMLDVGGQAFLPKGMHIEEELRAGKRAVRRLGAEIVSAEPLPGTDTRLVIVHKSTLTPKKYPRRPGTPSQSPLGVGA